jgi:hypothetical protein
MKISGGIEKKIRTCVFFFDKEKEIHGKFLKIKSSGVELTTPQVLDILVPHRSVGLASRDGILRACSA